jgi:excisionase family DNA binding protein
MDRTDSFPELLTVREAAEVLKISRQYVYVLMGSGRLPFVMVGTVRRIPAPVIREMATVGNAPNKTA